MIKDRFIGNDEAFQKAMEYCAREEKCCLQVRQKLIAWGVDPYRTQQILDQLILENYINEKRFAREYALGKFRNNKWGKYKIANGLNRLQIPEENIEQGLGEIDHEDYLALLSKIITGRLKALKGPDKKTAIKKIATFAIGKGFEAELVWRTIKQLAVGS